MDTTPYGDGKNDTTDEAVDTKSSPSQKLTGFMDSLSTQVTPGIGIPSTLLDSRKRSTRFNLSFVLFTLAMNGPGSTVPTSVYTSSYISHHTLQYESQLAGSEQSRKYRSN